MILFVTIAVVVFFIYFQQQIYKRHTKRFDNKTKKRYEQVVDELRTKKEEEKNSKTIHK